MQKDRFLKAKIAEHPDRCEPCSLALSKTILLKLTYVLASDVSVELIASFNKMKALSKEVGLVVQAMVKSPMLEVSAIVDAMRTISENFLHIYRKFVSVASSLMTRSG